MSELCWKTVHPFRALCMLDKGHAGDCAVARLEGGPTVASEQAEQAWTAYINSHDHGSSRRDAFLAGWQAGRNLLARLAGGQQDGVKVSHAMREVAPEQADELLLRTLRACADELRSEGRLAFAVTVDDAVARLAGGKQGVSLEQVERAIRAEIRAWSDEGERGILVIFTTLVLDALQGTRLSDRRLP